MRLLGIIALVCCAGCYQPGGSPGPSPDPAPVFDNPIADASAKAFDAYRAGMAAKWREAANRADQFKGHADAHDWLSIETGKTRESAFAGHVKAIDDALKPQDESDSNPFDPKAFAKAYNAAADGAEHK